MLRQHTDKAAVLSVFFSNIHVENHNQTHAGYRTKVITITDDPHSTHNDENNNSPERTDDLEATASHCKKTANLGVKKVNQSKTRAIFCVP